jgi:hypothetical protein
MPPTIDAIGFIANHNVKRHFNKLPTITASPLKRGPQIKYK